jgi:hypothetical protein
MILTQIKTVTLDYYGSKKQIKTLASSVNDFLLENKIYVSDSDIVEPEKNTFLDKNSEIKIYEKKELSKVDIDSIKKSHIPMIARMEQIEENIPFGEENKASRKGVYSISSKALAFWFRFVLPNKTAIATGKPVLENLTEEIDGYIEGKLYEQICMQYMLRKNKQGMLPFLSPVISGYWNSLKEYSDAKIVAANQRNRQILFAEYRRSFSEPGEQLLSRLRKNDKLFPEYWERFDMLFSVEQFPREIRNLENMKLKLVDVEGLYK